LMIKGLNMYCEKWGVCWAPDFDRPTTTSRIMMKIGRFILLFFSGNFVPGSSLI